MGADRSRSPAMRSASFETDAKLAEDHSAIKTEAVVATQQVEAEDELVDGHSAQDIFGSRLTLSGYTYDDLICLPGEIGFGVHDVVLHGNFTRRIALSTPLVSSPMDTVTEASMAIAMALQGGIGVIHTNLSIEDQVNEVRKVKRYECGFITDPVCITPTMKISEVDKLRAQRGFSGYPVTEDGHMGSRLLGLVTKRDTDFVRERQAPVSTIMTRAEHLVTAGEGVDLQLANKLLRESKKGKLPVMSKSGRLLALVSRSDLQKTADFPNATTDVDKHLRVAAAVGTRPADKERVRALVAAGVDAVVVDSSQGDSIFQHDMVRWIKQEFPELQVVADRKSVV